MIGLLLLVVSIGLADSVNPTTLAPALYLATTERPRASVAAYTVGVFAVYLLGGLVLTLGPGQLLLSAVPHPDRQAKHVIEIVVGVLAGVVAVVVWLGRHRIQAKMPNTRSTAPGSAFVLGAGITLVELPTAFPYFAAIAAIVGSGRPVAVQVTLLVIFNVMFVLPLIGVMVVQLLAGSRGSVMLGRFGDWLQRRSAVVIAAFAALVAVVALTVGAIGLARTPRHHRARAGVELQAAGPSAASATASAAVAGPSMSTSNVAKPNPDAPSPAPVSGL